jgi:hypothetical protein
LARHVRIAGTTACRELPPPSRRNCWTREGIAECLPDAEGMTETKRTHPIPATDEQVRTLLERYKCPVPFHEVRTQFLGNIATPVVSASPLKVVEDLWGGELPAFDSIDAANE